MNNRPPVDRTDAMGGRRFLALRIPSAPSVHSILSSSGFAITNHVVRAVHAPPNASSGAAASERRADSAISPQFTRLHLTS
jgi:hypothetical protein